MPVVSADAARGVLRGRVPKCGQRRPAVGPSRARISHVLRPFGTVMRWDPMAPLDLVLRELCGAWGVCFH
jgi:hypothetical protein